MKKCLATIALGCFFLNACVIRFRNSERGLDASFRKVYVPAATDISTRAGPAARISYAVRRAMALKTQISLVPLDEARLGVDIQVNNQTRSTVKALECNKTVDPARQTVASKSYTCSQLGFSQATVSSEVEAVTLNVVARAIDLNTGKVFFTKTFEMNRQYQVVAPEGELQNNIAALPEVHALRYQENGDNATVEIAEVIADQVVDSILSLDPALVR